MLVKDYTLAILLLNQDIWTRKRVVTWLKISDSTILLLLNSTILDMRVMVGSRIYRIVAKFERNAIYSSIVSDNPFGIEKTP